MKGDTMKRNLRSGNFTGLLRTNRLKYLFSGVAATTADVSTSHYFSQWILPVCGDGTGPACAEAIYDGGKKARMFGSREMLSMILNIEEMKSVQALPSGISIRAGRHLL